MNRPPRILHCTSEPFSFFGRESELALLDRAVAGAEPSVVALVGPGGQGKTAIVQHWLQRLTVPVEGLFFWSFYRGKDVDRCLREWLAYAEGSTTLPEVSGNWCVDRLLTALRRERWAVVLDGAEVVQYEDGPWQGRFIHPDLGRLLEELATESMPGLLVLTTRFPLPTLVRRSHIRLVSLERLDLVSACGLLRSLGVQGGEASLEAVAREAGLHAKAVELLGTYLVAQRLSADDHVLGSTQVQTPDDEEQAVLGVLAYHQRTLPEALQDIIALGTAFREPPTEALLLDYLAGTAVKHLLHDTWRRTYPPFDTHPEGWLKEQVDTLVRLRLLERVGPGEVPVIDAHPLVRRGFEHRAGPSGHQQSALTRAGFLRGRPDRRRPTTLEEAREQIELFHAHCDAGLWTEADSALVALENPKHRFLAPVLERDLLLRFFPGGDWRQRPLWSGFGRRRSLAICLEMLGQFDEALEVYPAADAALRGDALIALGRLEPILSVSQMTAPWQTLWQAYRCHALCLAGRVDQAVTAARTIIPVDIYEWVHVFECLLRAGRLDAIDLRSILFRTGTEHRWAELSRRRMRADYLRATEPKSEDLGQTYRELIQAYDEAGLVVERVLTRLSYTSWLLAGNEVTQAETVHAETLALIERSKLDGYRVDAWEMEARLAAVVADATQETTARQHVAQWRERTGIQGPMRG